ncbi:protein FATTY ACID EXPORT 1, chloroplastic-like isoform X2 [Gastrolobium bilobum]|uniref:protein FATTY ACID EXPORT 1, chloroplastic-like isoform X2 n=1 Tax=Gastrolobium bilobum TaxID=150636 RepID=UPI002AAF2294|nr:protein FATTY ACID EXPORT 1, chloroplastic-like isoform X2 [Gastrolobium bilobum]
MTATAMAATVSQFSCFSDTSRSLHRSLRFNSKLSVVMSLERHDTNIAGSDAKSTLSYAAEKGDAEKVGLGGTVLEGLSQQKRTAKIHDFCLGIPFGGFVLGGGIIGFLLTRSLTTLSNGVLFGGAILLLSTLSLKVWRQGKSSLPFILGQSALSGILIWKNFQSYSLAKKVFPTGISAILSFAMLCFYLYVLISGGNPPPKKNKSSANMAS